MTRERQLLLSGEDPGSHPSTLRLDIDEDRLELPHLDGDREQRSVRNVGRPAEHHDQAIPRERRIGEDVHVPELQVG